MDWTTTPNVTPYIAQKYFNLFCFLVNHRYQVNKAIDAQLFTQGVLDAYHRTRAFEP
jgi:hypothetical protein